MQLSLLVLVQVAACPNARLMVSPSSCVPPTQIQSLAVDPAVAAVAGNEPAAGSSEAAEIELLLDADRRGILDENFAALLSEPQKRALAVARRSRLADKAADRNTSLIFGVVLILGGVLAYGVGRAARRRSATR